MCGWGVEVSDASVSFCLTMIGHMHQLFEYAAHKKFVQHMQGNEYGTYSVHGTVSETEFNS